MLDSTGPPWRCHDARGPGRPANPRQNCDHTARASAQSGRHTPPAQHTRLGSMAGRAPLQLPEPQRQGDQWRRPERHHAGPELVPQPEHEVAVQLQHHQPAFARVAGDADRTERRYDSGLWHATRHGLLSRPVEIEPADRNRRAHLILNLEADTWHLIPAPGGPHARTWATPSRL